MPWRERQVHSFSEEGVAEIASNQPWAAYQQINRGTDIEAPWESETTRVLSGLKATLLTPPQLPHH
jgi:hypothetical protein